MRTITYKRGGGSNCGDFRAYVLCGWPQCTLLDKYGIRRIKSGNESRLKTKH